MNAVATAQDGTDFTLDGAIGVATFYIGDSPYAIVTANNQDSVQVIDLRDPSSPVAAGIAVDGERNFTMLKRARGVATFTINASIFAIVCGTATTVCAFANISPPPYSTDIPDDAIPPHQQQACNLPYS